MYVLRDVTMEGPALPLADVPVQQAGLEEIVQQVKTHYYDT